MDYAVMTKDFYRNSVIPMVDENRIFFTIHPQTVKYPKFIYSLHFTVIKSYLQ